MAYPREAFRPPQPDRYSKDTPPPEDTPPSKVALATDSWTVEARCGHSGVRHERDVTLVRYTAALH